MLSWRLGAQGLAASRHRNVERLATSGSLLHAPASMSADATSFYTESSKHGSTEPPKGHTYKQAGVDIREAAGFVGDIGPLVKRTQKQRQLAGAFGLFAAAY